MGLQTENNFFGLDISDKSLRLVQLKNRGKKNLIISYNEVSIPEKIISNGDILDSKKMIELIKKTVKGAKGSKVSTKNVIAVLPETKTFIKVIDIDLDLNREEKEGKKSSLEDLIKQEIVNHFPLDVSDIYMDWQVLKEETDKIKLLIGAVPKNISDSYVQTLEKSGLSPQILEIEAAAIIRSLIPATDHAPRIIIDFGANRTGLIVYDRGTAQFTVSLPISGERITKTIADTLKIDLKKSEQVKIICGLDKEKCEGALRKVLFDAVNELAESIKKSINYYQENYEGSGKIAEVMLCGGGANFLKIDQVLQEKIGLPVKIGNPLINEVINKKNGIPREKLLSYTTAIGLALRPFEKKS